jgi:membrane-associated PAP2 superfamily phosphatase
VPLLLAWDSSSLDMATALWFGGTGGFALKDDWWLSSVLHDGGRRAAWVVLLVALLMVWWPQGAFRRIGRSRRIQLVVTGILATSAVATLKAFSGTSCPWDLAQFGQGALHVSHWAWGSFDGGNGRCFPAGHASAGFAFIGGYFAFARGAPQVSRIWLAVALLAGLVFGLAQQARGAHFMSHTLWTAWLCWVIALALDRLWPRASTEVPKFAAVASDASIQ